MQLGICVDSLFATAQGKPLADFYAKAGSKLGLLSLDHGCLLGHQNMHTRVTCAHRPGISVFALTCVSSCMPTGGAYKLAHITHGCD